MNSRQKILSGNTKYIIALLLLVLISLVFFVNTNSDFDLSRREVLLRRIGHEILLQSGDSTSRVLPIEKIAENEYQISFEKEFSFVTDSLVDTTQRLLAKDYHVSDYIVNVINCDNSSVAYGYAISKNKKEDILACVGRKQPIACYKINIKFKPSDVITANYKYYLLGLAFLLFVGFIFWKLKPKKELPKIDNNKLFTFGSVVFDAQKRQLEINAETIDLTATETRLLLIFASSPNETIERSRLQKEIWEDEGVIVGRSLDMFISKLRKKLELDPNINIIVVRGKGYKLEVKE
ncbi:winged helix-turn-helix domain-containing protein [Flavobacterium proteolyticum]|uniref:Winged helix-turn-helix transcriptional regulator n=1 Tax=Flavobacterium proteolyticum TaxID=2911683 RepID=A0ABR9WTV9_9FLAO|nr:winged helix-turn-helix domain-containing protein [Flavobacterium proteolyticum]MBE9577081.1 winged helix-turn-helix transcriptional regulator [Flavobacterium proteolyticum]